MQSTILTHAKLRLSESNVRKANGDAGLEALAASIAEHGLLQPLIVSPSAGKKTLYDVHAGAADRRTGPDPGVPHGTVPPPSRTR